MSVRIKTIVISILVYSCFFAIICIKGGQFFVGNYDHLQLLRAEQSAETSRDTINRELTRLSGSVTDWGVWTETYRFIAGEFPAYVEENLGSGSLSAIDVDAMVLLDKNLRVVLARQVDKQHQKNVPFSGPLIAGIQDGTRRIIHKGYKDGVSGVLFSSQPPFMMSIHRVSTSNYEKPFNGYIIFGKYLDNYDLLLRGKQLGLKLGVRALDAFQGPAWENLNTLSHNRICAKNLSDSTVAGYSVLPSYAGGRQVVLISEQPRAIYHQGRDTFRKSLFALLILGVLLLVTVIIVLETVVLSRVTRLSAQVAAIGQGGNLSARLKTTVSQDTRDEINVLTFSINSMLSTLEQAENEARDEVATSETLLRSMTSASPLAFYVVDNRTDDILYFNDRFCQIWNVEHLSAAITAGDLNNKDILSHCIPLLANAEAIVQSCDPLGDEANRAVLEDEIALRDGRTIRRYSTQICGAEDAYFGRLYVFEDITARKRVEEELRENVTWTKAIFDNVHAGIMVVDAHTHEVVDINASAVKLIGAEKGDIVGSECHKYICPNKVCPVVDLGLKVDNAEGVIYTPDGTEKPIIKTVVSIHLGGRKYLLESMIDISRRKQAEEALNRRDSLLVASAEATRSLLAENDPSLAIQEALRLIGENIAIDRCYIFQNSQDPSTGAHLMSQVFEWTRDGANPQIDNPELQNLPYDPVFSRWLEKLSQQEMMCGLVSDFPESERPILEAQEIQSLLIVPIWCNNMFWGFIGFDDCSSERLWSAGETAILEAIADSIGSALARNQVEKQLVEAKDTAERASAAKGEFLANMSHEIRTPLNGVVGMSELLLNTPLEERQPKYTRSITYSAELLLDLISDILDFSKIEAGKLEIEKAPFNLHETIEGLASTMHLRANSKGVELLTNIHPSVPENVMGDQARIRQILLNLISNAIKFTEKGEVLISCRADSLSNNKYRIRLEIKDTGIGIPTDRKDRLFKSFSQVDASTTRKYGGTGLGLAICKRLVEAQGGELGVESEPGKGSMFWFTLDFEAAEGMAEHHIQVNSSMAGLRVLIADDNPTNREILKEQLCALKAVCKPQKNGDQAFKTLLGAANTKQAYQVAVLDGHMPGMDGIELAQKIRATAELTHMAIIIISSREDLALPQSLQQDSRLRYLYKPIRRQMLLDAIGGLMGESAEQPQDTAEALTENILRQEQVPYATQVLVAEDNQINQMVVSEILSGIGIGCDIVDTGVKAIEAAATGRYSLILMDCQMPEMDGYQATKAIRLSETDKHTPIIALTANATDSDRSICLAAGMDDYLSKPVTRAKLVSTVQQWLAKEAKDVNASELVHPVSDSADESSESIPLDYETLLNLCGGDAEFAWKLLSNFVQRTPAEIEEIKDTLAVADCSAIESKAHRIKGAAATLAAEPLRNVAYAMEIAGRNCQIEAARENFNKLVEEFERLRVSAQRYSG